MHELFSFIHLSDIHTGHGDAQHGWDQRLVLEALAADIAPACEASGVPRPDALLVTGDVAFSGGGRPRPTGEAASEYEGAEAFLDRVAGRAGLDRSRVFVVPGNHDIDRAADRDRATARLCDALREGRDSLDSALVDPGDRARLASRMAAYLAFAGRFAPFCGEPRRPEVERLFWCARIQARSGLQVRLLGLNTALLSADDRDHGRLRLGKAQLQALIDPEPPPGELALVLTHHPLREGWLADQGEAEAWIRARAHVHLAGHVHEQSSEEARSGSGSGMLRLVAGAAHGEGLPPGVPAAHGYGLGVVVEGASGRLRLRVFPRRWSDRNKDFRPDTDNTPRGSLFAEHDLRLSLPPKPRAPARRRTGAARPGREEARAARREREDASGARPVLVAHPAASLWRSVAISPDGALVAAGEVGGLIVVWDAATELPLRTLVGHTAAVSSLAVSRDGRVLASGSRDGSLGLWSLETFAPLGRPAGDERPVNAVALSPRGDLLASGSEGEHVTLQGLADGSLRGSLPHGAEVHAAVFGEGGRTLVTGAEDGVIRIWDAESRALTRALRGGGGPVCALALGPGGALAAASDRAVCILDAASGALLRSFETGSRPLALAFVPGAGGAKVAAGLADGAIQIWDAASGERVSTLLGHGGRVTSLSVSEDGRTLVSGAFDWTVRLWALLTGEARAVLSGERLVPGSLAVSADGPLLVTGSDDARVRVWDSEAPELRATLGAHEGVVGAVAISPDGESIASGSHDRSIRIWSARGALPPRVLEGHEGWVLSVAFGPDGRALASGSEDRTARLWDLETPGRARVFEGHGGAVTCVAFGPGGRRLATGSEDFETKIWDAATGAMLASLVHPDRVRGLSLSADGRALATASHDGVIRIWDAARFCPTFALKGHLRPARAVAFSPDGGRLASCSDDWTVRLWDPARGELLRVLEGHTDQVAGVAFGPGGRLLASCSLDTTVRLWRAKDGACLGALRPTAGGWVLFTPDGRYRTGGEVAGSVWHALGRQRFELGALDQAFPGLRLPDDVRPFSPTAAGWG